MKFTKVTFDAAAIYTVVTFCFCAADFGARVAGIRGLLCGVIIGAFIGVAVAIHELPE